MNFFEQIAGTVEEFFWTMGQLSLADSLPVWMADNFFEQIAWTVQTADEFFERIARAIRTDANFLNG